MQNYLFIAGQTKAEKYSRKNLFLPKKNQESCFQYYYGKGKAHALPLVKTLSKLIKKSERTVQRWLNNLEKAKGIKSVPAYWENAGMDRGVCLHLIYC